MHRLFLAAALLTISVSLAACGLAMAHRVSGMNANEIQTLDNRSLCNRFADGAVVAAERQRRGLGDCSHAHLKCTALGYSMGTPLYLQCRALQATD